jgi:hypothetical protein
MGTSSWIVRTIPTGQTVTIVAVNGARVLRAEKQTPESVATFDPDQHWLAGNVGAKRTALKTRAAVAS